MERRQSRKPPLHRKGVSTTERLLTFERRTRLAHNEDSTMTVHRSSLRVSIVITTEALRPENAAIQTHTAQEGRSGRLVIIAKGS